MAGLTFRKHDRSKISGARFGTSGMSASSDTQGCVGGARKFVANKQEF